MPEPVDLMVDNAHLFTLAGPGVGYVADGAVAIRDGRVVEAGAAPALTSRYEPAQRLDAGGGAVLPGLVDVHMHTHYAVVRGVAQDVANWMQRALAPFSRHVTPEAARAGTRLDVVEALLAGTTTFGDYLRPYEGWAETFEEAGVRACLTPSMNAFPPGGMARWRVGDLYPLDEAAGDAIIDRSEAFVERWHGAAGDRIRCMLGPQGPDMLTGAHLERIRRIAIERDLDVHMHVAQGDRETDQVVARHGMRSIAYLERIGYLDRRLLAVHLTEATDEEARIVARSGARMALCSGSIGIIDGIVPPARAFRDAGGVVGLGSDQASGNNCSNVFNEMKLTALFNKIAARDPEAMPAWEVLRMATIDGARALGLGDEIGSLEPGKQADLIVIDLRAPNLAPVLVDPVRTIVPNLVYAGTGKEVRDVVVAGRVVVRDRTVRTLPVEAILDEAQAQADAVARRVAQDPLRDTLDLARATREGRL